MAGISGESSFIFTVKPVRTTPLPLVPASVNDTELMAFFVALIVCGVVEVVYSVPSSIVRDRPVV